MKKQKTLPQLKKTFWKVFSEYIRRRDNAVCFTCRTKVNDYYDRLGCVKPGWKATQAGHFITAANCGLALYFHEQNVHCQCHRCNVNLSGNWLEYEKRIIEVYGQKTCDELKSLKWTGDIRYTAQDYEAMIEDYKCRIEREFK